MNSLLHYSEEVQQAKLNGKAIVALESTIITHGMEYPTNVETALLVEEEIRNQGAVPATIAIIKGVIHIGLTKEQINEIGANKKSFNKCSRRDLGLIIAQKGNGSTTVAATMICANWAGIQVFVTGGIGGVHRGAETTFDISADLIELGQTPVAVVCAGAKSILDIPKTLEFLETQGVPVVGYKTKQFPNFFTPDSGQKCSASVNSSEEAALLIDTQFNKLKLKNGILISVPIPEADAADGEKVQAAINQVKYQIYKALQESEQQNIHGAEATPFLLKRINEITEGMSSKSNISLIRNNARVGAQIAVNQQSFK